MLVEGNQFSFQCELFFPLSGTIEEKIYQRQVSKQGLSGTVVDLGKKGEHINFSAEELRDLFIFDPDTDCLTHNLLGCKCSGEGSMAGDTNALSGSFLDIIIII